MSDLVPLLREGASDHEVKLLRAARNDLPADAATRERALAAAKSALQLATVAGAAGTVVKVSRWFTGFGLSTAQTVWLGGVGVVAALSTASLLTGAPSPRESRARLVPASSGATGPIQSAERGSIPATPRSFAPPSSPAPWLTPTRTPGAPSGNEAKSEGTDPSSLASAAAPAPPGTVVNDLGESTSLGRAEVVLPPGSASPAPSGPSLSLRAETALLAAASSHFRDAQPEPALASLDRYEAEFPAGVLAEDAGLLRIQVLLALHDRVEARRVADRFQHRFPSSPYVAKILSLLAQNR